MKKQNIKWIVLVVLALIAAGLWQSYVTDPLASLKEAKVEVVNNPPEVQAFMSKVLAAIENNDQRGLYELFGSGDAMAFNRNYLKKYFKNQDFCPAEIREYRKVTRSTNNEVFYEIKTHSTKRNKSYLFTLENKGDIFRVSSLAEIQE
ncbi:MAG: hypothetical protein IJT83_07935 [Victivallales bacterium]|nr:hypothetical protein [Victivallales bacterium]